MRRSTPSLSTCGGNMQPAVWISTIRASRIRCWSIFVSGLDRSKRPNRIFEAVLARRQGGRPGRAQAGAGLDGTLRRGGDAGHGDADARSRSVGCCAWRPRQLAAGVRAALKREDNYEGAGKPTCDWTTRRRGSRLVDALAKDGVAVLVVLDGKELTEDVTHAGELLATVLGQDLEKGRTRSGLSDRAAGGHGPGDLHGGFRRPAMDTRRRRAASTATKATSPSTPIRRSSPRPRSARATPGTPASPRT